MELPAGTRVGPYEIDRKIGAGGMGVVYGARDDRLGRQVAIKVLPAAVIGDADRLRRFEQEARTVGGLNHPNLVILHDVGRHEGAIALEVRDDGIGLPPTPTEGFGLHLVRTLAHRLGGTMTIVPSPGCTVRVVFTGCEGP